MTGQRHVLTRIVALRLMMAAVLSVAGLAVPALPASADWSFNDGLEADTSHLWSVGGSGPLNDSRVYSECRLARSGCGGAIITQTGPGFMSVGRTVMLGAAYGDRCVLSGHLQRRIYGHNNLRVNVEVLHPSTWQYLAVRTETLHGPGSGIWDVGTASFDVGGVRKVFIRFSVLGDAANIKNTVNVDDVRVRCVTPFE